MKLPIASEGALALRRRSSWEAADSGLLLWRDSFVYFIPLFALPIWLAGFGFRLLPEFLRPWSYLFLWWLKPFFDRFALHVISIRFFEAGAGMKRFFRGLEKSIFRGLLGDLLWRRFSPWRSSRMPVRLLENLRGKQLRQRKRLLERGGLDFCLLITILGLIIEGVLLLGGITFSSFIVEMIRPDLSFSVTDIFAKYEIVIFVLYCFNYMLMESLYVCMGFGLYINSRVEVEGWDIQLLFQNFAAAKNSPRRFVPAGRLAGITLLCIFLLFSPVQGPAQDADNWDNDSEYYNDDFYDDESSDEGEVKVLIPGPRTPLLPLESLFAFPEGPPPPLEDLEEILKSDDFGSEKESWEIRFKDNNNGDEGSDGGYDFSYLPGWMEKFRQGFAFFLRLILGALILGGTGFVLYRYYKYRQRFSSAPETLMQGRSTPAEDSPGVLLDSAEEFYRRGNIREAWASCLAGTIAAYTVHRGIVLPPGATEYGCLTLVRNAESGSPQKINGFENLILTWVRFAYAGKDPAPGEFEKSLGFGRSLLEAVHG
ncbi:membrane protein [Spirochaetia bacterium]|nr:membrane protein [Spirochaetia bacterium]